MMDKVVEGGCVAVIYHPTYGSGWYTWHNIDELLFDPMVVDMIRCGADQEEFEQYMHKFQDETRYSPSYHIKDLDIFWVKEGTDFIVREYDGSEWIDTKDNIEWIRA